MDFSVDFEMPVFLLLPIVFASIATVIWSRLSFSHESAEINEEPGGQHAA
jgi:hypothetical protein